MKAAALPIAFGVALVATACYLNTLSAEVSRRSQCHDSHLLLSRPLSRQRPWFASLARNRGKAHASRLELPQSSLCGPSVLAFLYAGASASPSLPFSLLFPSSPCLDYPMHRTSTNPSTHPPIHPSTHPRTTNPLPPHPLAVQFVWDDRAAVLMNSDVRPGTPLSHLLVHDFWGQPINTAGSHKSYRPLCVLSFRASFLHARLTDVVPDEYRRHREERATEGGGATATPPLPVDLPPGPYAFHFGNVAIHAVASAMVVLVAMGGPVVSLQWSPFEAGVAGLVFAVHPVRGRGGEGEETEQEKEKRRDGAEPTTIQSVVCSVWCDGGVNLPPYSDSVVVVGWRARGAA